MFLPSYRYTPAITEGLADLERLQAKVGRLAEDLEALETARRRARAARTMGAARLDGIVVSAPEVGAILAGRGGARPPAMQQAVTGYLFALDQIASDWPAERAVEAPPVIAGLHFFVTPDPTRRAAPSLRRGPGALVD